MKLIKFILTGLLAIACSFSTTLQAQHISQQNLQKHIELLSSDKMKGRGTSSKEEAKAAAYIAKQFKKSGLKPMGTKGYYHEFTYKKSSDPHGADIATAPTQSSRNVVAYLDNGAPYTIVVGGHYDHLGLGFDHNSLDPNPEGKIHNGADDNASGTAGVIELARYLANNNVKEQHNFLFICFSGEELGLVGSKKFTENPTIDLSKVSFMVNMDMIGRMNPEKRIMVGGVGTAPNFVPTIEGFKDDLGVKLDSAGIGPSDHTSFYLKDIPVLFFFTGQHNDYHKPSDDADKINYNGERELLEYVLKVVMELDKEPKLVFQKTISKTQDTPSFKVTLGIMPDYTWEEEGVHVDGVTDGKPAFKAGILRGDIIVGLGEIEVKNMQDYMKGLSMFQKGDSTKVRIKRNNELKELDITF